MNAPPFNVRANKNFSDEIFPNFVAGKEFNKNFTEKSVAKAKLPSNFPIFPKFCPISENPRTSDCGRGSDFGGEKTSLNSDVKYNKILTFYDENGGFLNL